MFSDAFSPPFRTPVGKTQLAVEYAWRHAGDYALVWWLRAEEPATLAADYAALAAKLDLPEKDDAKQPVIIAAVRKALLHQRDWLLIFDNAEAPAAIRAYLPGAGGHVLITSRHPDWRGIAQPVEVKKWPPGVAIEFLLKRTAQTDRNAAGELARELDYLPLALEQAAAYIESRSSTLATYLGMFREHRLALLNREKPSTDYPDTVATTWEISFQRLEQDSPAGAALLNFCAFLAPDDIPCDVIVSQAEYLPSPLAEAVVNPLEREDAIRAIKRYSLIEGRDGDSLSIHRLVQAVIRDRLDDASRKVWAKAALNIINQEFPFQSDDVRTWPECARLSAHATLQAERLPYTLSAAALRREHCRPRSAAAGV